MRGVGSFIARARGRGFRNLGFRGEVVQGFAVFEFGV